ncbi:hypothetical protein, partial [Paeniglutamicibacter gangotriensis]|uniref:hypothetical protein n=1 Tax=Paeniglutamicibacter gangotriensis TaxID=254787 RepID=UPI001CB6D48E
AIYITIERTKKDTPKVCPPGSIIHKKLLMQNKTKKEPTTPKGYRSYINLASQDARVHYTVPKQQPHHTHHQHTPQKR